MNVAEAIKARRAVKHYDLEHVVTDEEVTELFTLA